MKYDSRPEYQIKYLYRKDCCDFYKFKKDSLDGILDIGANLGYFSILGRVLQPSSKIVAVEPCPFTFSMLKENLNGFFVDLENFPLGKGEKLFLRSVKNESTRSQYVSSSIPSSTHEVESKTLEYFYNKYFAECNSLFIKIDIEGGESCLVDCRQNEEIIKKSKQTVVELHFAPEFSHSLTYNEYYKWANDTFGKTNKVLFDSIKDRSGRLIISQ